MSFSFDAKIEMIGKVNKPCCAFAQSCGFLVFGRTFGRDSISLMTDHEEIAAAYADAVRFAAAVEPVTVRSDAGRYNVSVPTAGDRKKVMRAFGYEGEEMSVRLNFANIGDRCCRAAFIRGAFLACGSVTDPNKEYHLELSVGSMGLTNDFIKLFDAYDGSDPELDFTLVPNRSQRSGMNVIYFNDSTSVEDFLALTGAQARVFKQIREDLARPSPMLRLVQGDVGSGKTVVAALAAMLAVEQGKQVALAAPTELLAEQHLNNLRGWLEPLGVRIAWLAGKVTGKARAKVMEQVANGEAQVVVGTHALMQEAVVFQDLALAIVDEQHRFGVHQRLALRDKGAGGNSVPHQLVMTATPIPRTLAMSEYADLDVSAIDELPPGRTPVQTVALNNDRRPELIERIALACQEGRQVYWVCTLIEESEELDATPAQATYESLQALLPGVRVGLVHGRLKAAEKLATMVAFKAGEIDLLVATTVIEVGVDVPNASLMVIENAERLGLAQLHQLRGRVGRGSAVSRCVLLYQAPLSQMARERLQTMRETNDGFVIAEKDLELRGPGELLGTRQTGLAGFRIADLARDAGLLPGVHELAERLLAQQPALADRVVQRWIGTAVRYASA